MPARSEVFAPGMLAGRVALVTGGGTGLGTRGRDRARRVRRAVVICRPARGRAAAGGGGDRPRRGVRAGDVRRDDDAARMVRTCLDRHGRLDVLVNNAGGQYFAPAEAIEPKGWRAVTGLNVGGTERMTRTAAELAMRPAGARHDHQRHALAAPRPDGHGALERRPRRRRGLHASARPRVGRPTASPCSRSPPGTSTPTSLRKYPEPVWRGAARTVPLGRLGREQEHAWLVALAASPLGRALSGSVITLDGARDNWFGPWPPPSLTEDTGDVPTEERRPRRP